MMGIFVQTVMSLALLTPTAALADDITFTEKQLNDELAKLERSKTFLVKKLEVVEANFNLEKKLAEIAAERRKKAEDELKASRAIAETIPENALKITKVEATVRRIDLPDQTCDASAYVQFHCKGFPRCSFELTATMCQLPGPEDAKMNVSVDFKCGFEKEFSNETFKYNDGMGYLTCLGR